MSGRSSERDALRILHAWKSPNQRKLEWLESWVKGEQYHGWPDWWSDKVPQWERAPCIVYPIVRMAIEANVDMMLGERAFPRFKLDGDAKDSQDAIANLMRVTRFRGLLRESFAGAQGVGTSVAVFGVRDGVPFGDLIPAKWCEPEFEDQATFRVKRLVIQYPYIAHEEQNDGTWEAVTYLYRRVIDDKADTVFKPHRLISENRVKISWSPENKVSHGLGFCPVVWYPFMRGCQAVNVVHGKPLHEGHTQEIHAHDLSRSQWHKVALYSEPQPYEIGVNPDYNPGEPGREALVPVTEHGGEIHPDGNKQRGAFVGEAKEARKKGIGYSWVFQQPDAKVGYLTVPESAIKALEGNTLDMRQRIQEALGVVFLDPENIKFASVTSGKALAALKQKQLDRVDQYREDFRDGFMIPALVMLLQIVAAKGADFPESDKLNKLDARMLPFDLEVRWGSYQAPDFGEQKQVVELVNAALPLVGRELALQKLQESDVFEIESIEDVLKAVDAEEPEEPDDEMPEKSSENEPSVESDES